jgi:CsoR family transcriptional regulator, copper-sensing transcriptional repressor
LKRAHSIENYNFQAGARALGKLLESKLSPSWLAASLSFGEDAMPEEASIALDHRLEVSADDRSIPLVPVEDKIRSLNRLRRIEGQVRGLQRMIDEDRPCGDILTQVSSVLEALRAAGRELLRDHLKQSTRAALSQGETAAEAACDQLVELVFRHGR